MAHVLNDDYTLLVADKGAGKTRTGLAVAAESEGSTLILCPNKVRPGWVAEGRKIGLSVVLVEGTAEERASSLRRPGAHIFVMGVDLLPWLAQEFRHGLPFHGLILDETTRYGSPGAVGVKILRRLHKQLDWVLGLTAQPVLENPLALYGQALVIDGGRALGRSFDTFRHAFFMQMDYQGYDWQLQAGAEPRLAAAVAGLVYYMEDKAYEDSLVPLVEEVVEVEMAEAFWDQYNQLAEDMVLQLEGEELEAANEAVVSGKLEQLVQGAVYNASNEAVWMFPAKMGKLVEILDTAVPTIVVYQFAFELSMLRCLFPDGVDLRDDRALERFNTGCTNLLFMQFQSGSHGINAQERCCEMICLKPCWSADKWDQVIGRIRRRGQTRPCRRRTLVVPGSIDEVILARVSGKEAVGGGLLYHIKTRAGEARESGARRPV